ncbi:hypothetical protein DCO58_05655 [Helicobacter saguini]|uniref:PpiC domain-containing protein n=1 Tax=Helicobacter saguini TaxID=1548018 RepID=A0A347VTB4_9HELI|nr:SurA N-terminal domain-containing protein [Helicobacter saguini]MWV62167.1 hypothetical protein [Helicobacter saguini]MWV67160.1 hypothetical protein [Helicobacter saguini]MWV69512.1 hypothetical protein [Helicobacter saguini]MWV70937.1 hypothetical protein [Helicobacter saguini]TLD92528.1 hypothetical protein LS64_010075 [Helicobacter saguini]
MLEWMQRHKKWLVITVWISAFALVFGFYLPDVYSYFTGGGNNVAKVGKEYISVQEYDNEYNETYKRISEVYPNFDALNVDGGRVKEIESLAFERVVNRALLNALANEFDVVVTPNEVADELINGQYKQYFSNELNQFDAQIYKNALAQNGLNAERFEQNISENILLNKVQNFPNFPASTLEMNAFINAVKIKDNVALKVLDKDSALKNVTITLSENDVRNFWESNKAKYTRPASYKLAYIALNTDDIDIDENSLTRFYNDNAAQYGANALNTARDEIIEDYKKDYIKMASAYLQSMQKNIESKEKIYSNVLSNLNKDSINALKNAVDNNVQIALDSIPVGFVEIDDNDFLVYQNLLAKLPSSQKGFINPIYENGSRIWIIPYLLEKSPKAELSYDDAKDSAKQDLKNKKESEQFRAIVSNEMKEIKPNDFENVGQISLDSIRILGDSSNATYTQMANIGLDISQMRDLISKILKSTKTQDVVYVDDSKAVFFRINNQKMASFDEMINITNEQSDEIEQLKRLDMQNAMFEYAKSKYKIIDYRRQN